MWHAMGASGSHSTPPTGGVDAVYLAAARTLCCTRTRKCRPSSGLQAGRPFREERPFPRFVRQRGNENPAVQGAHGPPTASDRAPDYPEIVATLKRQAADFLRFVEAPTGLCVSVS